MTRWKEIWNGKETITDINDKDEYTYFTKLKKANGFDVAVGNPDNYFRFFYDEWIAFYEHIVEQADISSVYEVGCGSGVNLYMFKNRGIKRLGGCDYSASMIESTKCSVGDGDFLCDEAKAIDIIPEYDLVMSESVFQYFESLEYAEAVMRKMIKKSRYITYIGEIHDKEHERELMEYRKKTIKDYEKEYEGLSKLFISREWVESIAGEYGRKVFFTLVNNPEYLNGKYLYNCYITR